MQEFAQKISGRSIAFGKIGRYLPQLRGALLLVTLTAAAYTGKATALAYEPFGVAFSLDLTAAFYIWLILFLALGLSFLFPRLWCRGFCPAGALLDLLRSAAAAARRPKTRPAGEPEPE